MSTVNKATNAQQTGEPAWDIAELFPPQGFWTEEEYLSLTDGTNHLVELSDGQIEVLAIPTARHQDILMFLMLIVNALAKQIGGKAYIAGLRLRLSAGRFREPDIILLRSASDPRRHDRYLDGADLVMEIVSKGPEDRRRDLITKRAQYAQAGIPEYWTVDLKTETISVLALQGEQYAEHGRFARGTTATSALLPDLRVDVSAVFDAT